MTIGVFDSGVGGLWVLKHIQEKFPEYDYIYIADQAHIPYGSKSIREIHTFSEEITHFLINKGCQLIVVACNTASGVSLKYLRNKFPDTLFIGMEPALKPAIKNTKTGKIGILATSKTFKGELYLSVVEKFSKGKELIEHTCPGLVEEIEKGEFDSLKIIAILEKALFLMIKKGIDAIVLGCTHYPFVMPSIKKIVGRKINIIDPTPAIVRQVGRIIKKENFSKNSISNAEINIFTSGDVNKMKLFVSKVLNKKIKIKKIKWDNKLKLK